MEECVFKSLLKLYVDMINRKEFEDLRDRDKNIYYSVYYNLMRIVHEEKSQ